MLIFEPRQATIPFPSHLYDDCYDEEKGSYGLKDLDAYSIGTTLRNVALTQKEKDPRRFTLPCYINNVCFEKSLVDLGAIVSVMPFSTYTNLGLGELARTKLTVELADRTMKHPKGIAENIIEGIGKFVFPVDFIILDIPEDVKVPLILERPFLSTAHAKIGYEYVDANFFPLLSINVMSKRFNNLIMKDTVEYKRKNIVGAFMNVPIFVGKFSIMTDFAVVVNMDAYRDERMGDIIVGRPICKEARIKANRLDEMITICKGNDNVTYQMARLHPAFKHLTNAQCNKIRPLLKVSAQDKLKGIFHPYQKLKGF
uniref:Reverse transcriptase domain-containing protein n=1 Tax=Tanacetum cinerariifolium TaxID=118510 RepID=A0A6L2LZV1_TANCI|nr:hypothetical protein [Tanacetum cinerariifolium]